MTRKGIPDTDERSPAERLGDLQPREEAPDRQAEVKGGLEPPNGLRLTVRPPNDPPNG